MFATKIGKDIDQAAYWLAQGETVAIPTETVYGLAADALQEDALLKIYSIKGRPSFNPLILHVGSINEIERYTLGKSQLALSLAEHFMPGPLSILLPRNTNAIPDIACAGLPTIAIRIPNNELTLALLQKYPHPLCAPSANRSGYVSPTSPMHVSAGLQGEIPYILDGGLCSVGIESTIVEVVGEDVFLHRQGGISVEEIENYIGRKIKIAIPHHEQPSTSGQLKSHYATTTPLHRGNIEKLKEKFAGQKIAIISFSKFYDDVTNFSLSTKSDLNEAAKNLFDTLRRVDDGAFDVILAEEFPNEGLGAAINDRLYRAAYTERSSERD
jgi:L-threonylcarbamoyladenylate synthase